MSAQKALDILQMLGGEWQRKYGEPVSMRTRGEVERGLEAALTLPPRQDEPGLREALERIARRYESHTDTEAALACHVEMHAALRAAPAEPQPAVDREVALFFEPCRDFAAPQSCYTNDGTGLWCATCTERRRVISGAATEPADGTD